MPTHSCMGRPPAAVPGLPGTLTRAESNARLEVGAERRVPAAPAVQDATL
ncbi:MAG: hypothetical protein GWN95_11700 [Gammaproteobacteria bacterium]|nr:hypothetical protein [Gammaproteobacteria bacterium]